MDIEGKVIVDLPLQEGISKAGNAWKKKEWVFETFGAYPKKVKIYLFGDRVNNIPIELGKSYLFSVDIESREFQGRWYTDVNCFAAREIQAPGASVAPAATPQGNPFGAPQTAAPAFGATPAGPVFGEPAGESNDDLPF